MKEIHLLLGAITLLLLGALPVVHGQQHAAPEESHVTLSLNEFQELFSSARLQEAERRLLDQRKMLAKEHERKLQDFEDWKRALQNQAQQERSHIFPENYQVIQHTAAGVFDPSSPESGVEGDVASFDLQLVLRVVTSKWTVVPLANTTSMVASDWSISWKDDGANEDFTVVDPITSSDTMLLLRNEQQVLATNRSGVFSVAFKAHTRVGKTRNLNTVSLSSLLYPLSSFTLRIANDGDESSVGDFAVQPASALLQVETTANFTDVKTALPLTADGIQVKWLDILETNTDETATDNGTASTKARGESEQEAPQVTATHEVLHTVGEGIIKSLHILEFASTSEMSSLNSVEFAVFGGERVRVTSVMGHALQSYSASAAHASAADASKLIRATFKSSNLESTVTLHVLTEMDTADISELVELPRIECKNVLRQVGHVAVVKDAQVEVHASKQNTRGVSHCEPSDISSQLRSNIDRPIILSYKYLNPDNSIVVSVKEHTALETLEATVDRIHYKAIVTDSHTVHNAILVLQSTKLQYLKLFSLPPTASMFTVAVNSVPSKPVEGDSDDAGGSILIPLLVGLDTEVANEGGSMQTSVELNYISSHDSLGRNGTLHLAPPQLELPISVMTVHLRLPKMYDYQFTGDFGSEPRKRLEYPVPSAFSYTTGKRVVEEDYKFSVVDDFWPEDVEPGKVGVKIFTPSIGTSFHFQRLLVVDTKTLLDAKYSERVAPKEKTWIQKFLGR